MHHQDSRPFPFSCYFEVCGQSLCGRLVVDDDMEGREIKLSISQSTS